MNKQEEKQQAIRNLINGLKALFFLTFPFFLAIIIWGIWMNPETYWQRLISFIGGIITAIATFYIELEIFA